MIGAIAGDIIGSRHEYTATKTTDFELFDGECRFTDDSVLTVAVADCLLHGGGYRDKLHEYFHAYPQAGYGGMFWRWAVRRESDPYNSWGNGSAMRVSPVGFAFDTMEQVLAEAKGSAEVTHSHPEGIRGAQAVAAAIFLARQGEDKSAIRKYVEREVGYDLSQTVDEIRPHYSFNGSCQETVPQAIIAFLESDDYEDAVRKAISLGGDADTLACITGGIAEAYYRGVPKTIAKHALSLLDKRMKSITDEFCRRFNPGRI